MRGIKITVGFTFVILAAVGCAAGPKVSLPVVSSPLPVVSSSTFHRVEKGQTLWRISKLYGMEVDDLAKVNNIQDSAKLEVGQQLIIPAGRKKLEYVPGVIDEDFCWPLKGKILSGFNNSVNNTMNKGINIAPFNSLNVSASRGGKVVFYSDDFLDLGKTIIIEHPEGFWTVYGRNQDVYVNPGDVIAKGAVIAKAGQAGRDKNVYLHFEIRKGSKSENPLFYLPR